MYCTRGGGVGGGGGGGVVKKIKKARQANTAVLFLSVVPEVTVIRMYLLFFVPTRCCLSAPTPTLTPHSAKFGEGG